MSTSAISSHGGNSRLIESRSAIDSCSRNHLSDPQWFAVWTKSRHENVAAALIGSLGIARFLPLKSESRQWSDRRQTVNVPLFSGYLFVKISLLDGSKLRILQVPGVAGFVGNSQGPMAIPEDEIEAVRRVVDRKIQCTVHTFLNEGDRVRVVRGPLAGIEGQLVRTNSQTRLVIAVSMIHRSLAVHVNREDVEPFENFAVARDRVSASSGAQIAAHQFRALEGSIQ